MNVIVGLGNPGHTFHQTRHNVGFMVVERLAKQHGIQVTQRVVNPADGRPAAVFGDYQDGETVRLVMPLTMMNESGDALKALALGPPGLLVVCDDVNLPLGALRLRAQGSDGGHHGLASCLQALGTEQVARLRVGVGVSSLPSDLESFVLSRFRPAELPLITRSIEQAVEACQTWLTEGIDAAMNRYNTAVKEE